MLSLLFVSHPGATGNYTFLATVSEFVVEVDHGGVIIFDQVRINVGDSYDPTSGNFTGSSSFP